MGLFFPVWLLPRTDVKFLHVFANPRLSPRPPSKWLTRRTRRERRSPPLLWLRRSQRSSVYPTHSSRRGQGLLALVRISSLRGILHTSSNGPSISVFRGRRLSFRPG